MRYVWPPLDTERRAVDTHIGFALFFFTVGLYPFTVPAFIMARLAYEDVRAHKWSMAMIWFLISLVSLTGAIVVTLQVLGQ